MYKVSLDLRNLERRPISLNIQSYTLYRFENIYLYHEYYVSDEDLLLYIDELDIIKAEKDISDFVNLLSFVFNIDITLRSRVQGNLHHITNNYLNNVLDSNKSNNEYVRELNKFWKSIILDEAFSLRDILIQSLKYNMRSLKLFDLVLYEEACLLQNKSTEVCEEFVQNLTA